LKVLIKAKEPAITDDALNKVVTDRFTSFDKTNSKTILKEDYIKGCLSEWKAA